MKFTSIIPAPDWYFVHERVNPGPNNERYVLHRLAAWGTNEEGKVVGLIPVRDDNGMAKLLPPPNTKGEYIHSDDLTPAMKNFGS